MVTLSNKPHSQPELAAVQGSCLEDVLKGKRHMTTGKARNKC
jgi:hypothetical protein